MQGSIQNTDSKPVIWLPDLKATAGQISSASSRFKAQSTLWLSDNADPYLVRASLLMCQNSQSQVVVNWWDWNV